MQADTHYAKSGDVHIAYQVFGEGPINMVLAPSFVSNVEMVGRAGSRSLAVSAGNLWPVAMLDKRGTGGSDSVTELPGRSAHGRPAGGDGRRRNGTGRADWQSEGAPIAALFAATYPGRPQALVLHGGFARFSSWLPTKEALEAILAIDQAWGTGASLPHFVPSRANDPASQRWWSRFERLGASPAAASALMRMNSQIDIGDILPTIRVPTLVIHRTEDKTINVEGGRYLAEHIPGAR